MKRYFGFKKETTLWSYSHGQPLWFVDFQKMLVLAIPIGIAACLFSLLTGLNLWWFLIPVNSLVSWRLFR